MPGYTFVISAAVLCTFVVSFIKKKRAGFIILIQFRFYIQLAYGELLKWYPVSAAEDALVCQMISREHFSKLKAFYRSN